MGFNTTIVVLNDRLTEIEKDPEFGKKLVAAIMSFDPSRRDQMPYVTGQTKVIGCHHAGGLIAYVVGGNTGHMLGFGGGYQATDDQIIKELNRQRLEREKTRKLEAKKAAAAQTE